MKNIYLLLFVYVLVNLCCGIAQSKDCGDPIVAQNSTNQYFDSYIVIDHCFYYYGKTTCSNQFNGTMKLGDSWTDISRNNTFVYNGQGSLCYSVLDTIAECEYISASSICYNECTTELYGSIQYNLQRDYLTCSTAIEETYEITITPPNISRAFRLNSSHLFILFNIILFILYL